MTMLQAHHPLIKKLRDLCDEAEGDCPNIARGCQLVIRGALALDGSVGRAAINAGHLVLDAIELAGARRAARPERRRR